MPKKDEPWFTWPLRIAIFVVASISEAWRWVTGKNKKKP